MGFLQNEWTGQWGISFVIAKIFNYFGVPVEYLAYVSATQWIILAVSLVYLYRKSRPIKQKNMLSFGERVLFLVLVWTPHIPLNYLLLPLVVTALVHNPFGLVYGIFLALGYTHLYSMLLPLWILIVLHTYGFLPKPIYSLSSAFLSGLWNKYKQALTAVVRFVRAHERLSIYGSLVVLIVAFYGPAINGFFQGDEWYYFTQTLPYTRHWWGPFKILASSVIDAYQVSSGAHVTPISNLLFFLNAQIFGLTFWPYQLLSIALHIVNTLLVFKLAKRLLKHNVLAYVAALFFGLTAVHEQAITWVMTYIWTQLSTTFVLLTLIETLDKRYKRAAWYLLLALLCKESSALLFLLIPFVLYLREGHGVFNKQALRKPFIWVAAFYIPFRFILPKIMLAFNPQPAVNAIPNDLMIFRAITYPLKALAEVFFPQKTILAFVENILTPLSYPQYDIERSVRGSNFLTFVQGAGSDLIVYAIAITILAIVVFAISASARNKSSTKNTLLIALAIIVLGSLPLLLVATYAPWWAYVTFIDSRHLYVISIGGALLFASCFSFMTRNEPKHMIRNVSIFGVILIAWGVWQFTALRLTLDEQLQTAYDRKLILSAIEKSVPKTTSKVILVKSDSGYYGFGLMPPFQTNLGQVLTIDFYQKKQLPEVFIQNSEFMTKNGGLAGEGYKKAEGNSFGYYIDENNMTNAVLKYKIDPQSIYAFSWNGTKHTVSDITKETRKKLEKKIAYAKTLDMWKTYTDKSHKFFLRYPPEYIVTKIDGTTFTLTSPQGGVITIALYEKPETVGLSPHTSNLSVDTGAQIGNDFTFRTIDMFDGRQETTVYPITSLNQRYFIPYKTNAMYFDISTEGPEYARVVSEDQTEQFNAALEQILSTLTHIP